MSAMFLLLAGLNLGFIGLLRERAEKAAKQTQERDTSDAGRASKKPGRRRQSIGEAFIKSLARTVGNQIGRQLMRGILGSMKR
ncbi:MAG: helicase HerA-like domain-containing protein [Gammaproteobacteria bacterium]